MTSPCGKIRIPINEEGSEQAGQIQEYLDAYHGEGIQHIALGSEDIAATVDGLRDNGIKLLDTIDAYYDLVDKRIPNHGENLPELRRRKILIDGAKDDLLLQIFTENQIGPIFFEIIQRKGNQGFGEGNFKALFESIELDQIRRGIVQAKAPA
jgi:4-hydroxyphenylpyruvate dioxygenase